MHLFQIFYIISFFYLYPIIIMNSVIRLNILHDLFFLRLLNFDRYGNKINLPMHIWDVHDGHPKLGLNVK